LVSVPTVNTGRRNVYHAGGTSYNSVAELAKPHRCAGYVRLSGVPATIRSDEDAELPRVFAGFEGAFTNR